MINVLLVVHLFIAIALVGVVLLQRSEGGALGIGGSGGGLMTGRAAGNLLTRTTAILAALFITSSLVLSLLANNRAPAQSIVDQIPAVETAPADSAPVPEQAPGKPSAPLAQ
ncbi:MAG: preprotein translocase subunit SecG [Alphaproteobacteria bacterium]|nr:preprotein translocase subunit SecG [Alphaproteobacteria bacterium]MBF0393077.1 preprotein translocase subunit SecG [Alphaproteobacteria bacterium]